MLPLTHEANRAVKFIRDQAQSGLMDNIEQDHTKRTWNAAYGAQAAAQAIRKMLARDDTVKEEEDAEVPLFDQTNTASCGADPLLGWSSRDVSVRKGHYCVLLKPQIVLQSERTTDSVVVLASATASLQSHTVMDNDNADDPVNGHIMNRFVDLIQR